MRVWKQIGGVIGFLALAAAHFGWVMRLTKEILDYSGYADFLIAHSASDDESWERAVVNYLSQPLPVYAYVILDVTGLALLYFAVHRYRLRSSAGGVAVVENGTSPEKGEQEQAMIGPHKTHGSERPRPTRTNADSLSIPLPCPLEESWDDPLFYGKLFSVNRSQNLVSLKFLPPVRDQRAESLLLLLLGYLKLLGLHEVPSDKLNESMATVISLTHNSEWEARFGPRSHYSAAVLAARLGTGCVLVNRLSEGGYLALTSEGEMSASRLATDLISRA